MALSQTFRPAWGVLEPRLVHLVGKWDIGATGAVGTKTGGNGLTLTRTGTGAYTIQLKGSNGVSARAQSILHVSVQVLDGTGGTTIGVAKLLTVTDSTGAITFKVVPADATTATELGNPSVIMVSVHARLSSAR